MILSKYITRLFKATVTVASSIKGYCLYLINESLGSITD